MEYIWAPWRVEYIRGEKPEGCILCSLCKAKDDAANFILYRGELNFVIMNKYPYNPGHLMVAPFRHIATPEDFTQGELCEHYEIVRKCIKALREAFNPQGFNLGTNLGKVAGAGIDDHVHTHIVPRWQGDTNFMPAIAQTKVISESMDAVYKQLKDKF